MNNRTGWEPLRQMAFATEEVYRRRISGTRIDQLPSGRLPARSPIEGRQVRIEPLDPELHASELYRASHDSSAARRIVSIPWVRAIPTKLECPSRVQAVWKPFLATETKYQFMKLASARQHYGPTKPNRLSITLRRRENVRSY